MTSSRTLLVSALLLSWCLTAQAHAGAHPAVPAVAQPPATAANYSAPLPLNVTDNKQYDDHEECGCEAMQSNSKHSSGPSHVQASSAPVSQASHVHPHSTLTPAAIQDKADDACKDCCGETYHHDCCDGGCDDDEVYGDEECDKDCDEAEEDSDETEDCGTANEASVNGTSPAVSYQENHANATRVTTNYTTPLNKSAPSTAPGPSGHPASHAVHAPVPYHAPANVDKSCSGAPATSTNHTRNATSYIPMAPQDMGSEPYSKAPAVSVNNAQKTTSHVPTMPEAVNNKAYSDVPVAPVNNARNATGYVPAAPAAPKDMDSKAYPDALAASANSAYNTTGYVPAAPAAAKDMGNRPHSDALAIPANSTYNAASHAPAAPAASKDATSKPHTDASTVPASNAHDTAGYTPAAPAAHEQGAADQTHASPSVGGALAMAPNNETYTKPSTEKAADTPAGDDAKAKSDKPDADGHADKQATKPAAPATPHVVHVDKISETPPVDGDYISFADEKPAAEQATYSGKSPSVIRSPGKAALNGAAPSDAARAHAPLHAATAVAATAAALAAWMAAV
ncbi:hypothetical protein THASP1DRAFT_27717 [Thamnocephalis sphaerospora]|uniref:Uncharacterized protein n=1 Tax=Thamnocephalis sphaerospora TaxID=78915 RepID=A0A4P9XYH6_9FUNG|nr:hypothetical protein THASP1DRAFT_27717 [Thamnocephalis sphaerospora]|eukprot:RKP10480.1 hypothetical protein THASP1DRAFT_27717 [Thamnocephalis sphaerospora]